jgi:outer membrane protein assembly factor BamB
MAQNSPSVADLLFVAFNSRVFAIDRLTGEIVWRWKASSGMGFVSILPDRETLFVSCSGYTWALDPRDGSELWHQKFAGEGSGIPVLATMRGLSDVAGAAAAEEQQRAAAAAAAAS